MLAVIQNPGATFRVGRIHLQAKEGSVSRPLNTQALHSRFTYFLQQCRSAVLAVTQNPGATLPVGRIHLRTIIAKETSVNRPLNTQALHSRFTYFLQQCRSTVLAVTQNPGATLCVGRIHLQTKEGSVSRPLSAQALYPISVGFTYGL